MLIFSGYRADGAIETESLPDCVQYVDLAFGHVNECRKHNSAVEEIWLSHGEVIVKHDASPNISGMIEWLDVSSLLDVTILSLRN